jgi:REP-associated tyrosine transposase
MTWTHIDRFVGLDDASDLSADDQTHLAHCETGEANLSKGMRQLNGVYTQQVNRRHGLVGHLLQGRFKAILVERDAYLLELARYVVLNPVRAGMASDASEWPWSSYRAMVSREPVPAWLETDWVLGQFGSERRSAQAGYAQFVSEGVGQGSIWGQLRHQVFLGSDGFIERFARAARPSDRLREVPRAQRRTLARPLSQYPRIYPERREAMACAFLSGVYTMQEIAGHFGVHHCTVSRAVRSLEAS